MSHSIALIHVWCWFSLPLTLADSFFFFFLSSFVVVFFRPLCLTLNFHVHVSGNWFDDLQIQLPKSVWEIHQWVWALRLRAKNVEVRIIISLVSPYCVSNYSFFFFFFFFFGVKSICYPYASSVFNVSG